MDDLARRVTATGKRATATGRRMVMDVRREELARLGVDATGLTASGGLLDGRRLWVVGRPRPRALEMVQVRARQTAGDGGRAARVSRGASERGDDEHR